MDQLPIADLNNIGNTCFMNSALQIFMRFDHLINFLKSYPDYEADILSATLEFIKTYEKNRTVAPKRLKSIMGNKDSRFKSFGQEDSYEFLFEMLDYIEESLKKEFRTESKESYPENVVSDLFDLQVKTILKSYESDDRSDIVAPNRFLVLSLPDQVDSVDLNWCLAEYIKKETLDGKDKWIPEGKDEQKAIKVSYITKYPKHLVVVLKRYSFTKKGKKIDTPVNVQEIWESEIFPDNVYYEFVGCVHQSGSLSSGHYTSYVKVYDRWFSCNDSNVSGINKEYVLKVAGRSYILLFNQKKRGDPIETFPSGFEDKRIKNYVVVEGGDYKSKKKERQKEKNEKKQKKIEARRRQKKIIFSSSQ